MGSIRISAGVSFIPETGFVWVLWFYGSPEIPKDSGHSWVGLLIRNCRTERVDPGVFIFKLIVFYWEIVKNVIVIFKFQFLIKNDLVTINDGIDLCID